MTAMKKFIILLAAVLALASCGSSDSSQSKADTSASSAQETETTTTTAAATTTTTTTAETAAPEESSEDESTPDDSSEGSSFNTVEEMEKASYEAEGILSSPEDIGLYDITGYGVDFAFDYGGETFYAYYTPDNWKIVDSYKITAFCDMEIICEALKNICPIHGSDMESYREPEDMAYEWLQHNIAYEILPEDVPWKERAKDVDIDPGDQGLSLYDMIIKKM